MDIDRDTYDALPVERIPKDEPARSDYLVRQLAWARATLSIIFSKHPEIEMTLTSFQRDNAKPLFGIVDSADVMHWTFKNPMGS